MKKIVVCVLILILGVGVLAACTGGKDDSVIRLNEVTHSVFYAPLYVAINNGYFEEEGITIELTNGGGSDKTMTAILTGEADIGLLGPETAVYVNLGGSTNYPIVFGQLTQKDGSFLIGRKAEPNFKWTDLAGSEIIGGRKGGMPAMSLEYALKKNNMSDKLTVNYDVQFDMIVPAFESGIGDYCTMFEPTATEYQNAGKGYIVASVGAEAGEMPYTCFMATRSYIEKYPEKVTGFMRAIIKAIDYVMTKDDAEIADSLAKSFPSTEKSVLKSAVKAYKAIDAYKSTPVMSEAEFNNMLDVLMLSGTISSRPSYTDIIDNTIAEALL